jgi:hypothetical protein
MQIVPETLTDAILIIRIHLPDAMKMDAGSVVRSRERVYNMNDNCVAPIGEEGWAGN